MIIEGNDRDSTVKGYIEEKNELNKLNIKLIELI